MKLVTTGSVKMNKRLLKKKLKHAHMAHRCFRAQIHFLEIHSDNAHDIIEEALRLIPESHRVHKYYKDHRSLR